ncbi:hypothetical protein ACN28S_20830 [Cystobacter fuscus]
MRILYSGQAKADANRSIHRRDEQLPLPMLAPEAKARLSPGASYDFDNDGAQEFFVKVTLIDPQHGDVVYGFLNRFDGTRIVDYEPAQGLPVDELNDVDHDGRPDLILAYELAGEPVFKRCALPRNNVGYLRHLAHALPDGHFSLDDSAAAAFAKRSVRARRRRSCRHPVNQRSCYGLYVACACGEPHSRRSRPG